MPDTFFMNVDYPAWTMQLARPVGSGVGRAAGGARSRGTLFIGQNSENLNNTPDGGRPRPGVSRRVRQEDRRRDDEIEVQPVASGADPHMDKFPDCVRRVRSRNLPAQRGYQAMAVIGMGVQAYRQHEVLFFDRRREKVSNKPIVT